jgi:hypothetical protein
MDEFEVLARDVLELIGCEKLEALLREAPATQDEDERRIRNACWAAIAKACGKAA